jgi:hypothetical protein
MTLAVEEIIDFIVTHSPAENLAYACAQCNWLKGTDLGSIAPVSGQLVRFF